MGFATILVPQAGSQGIPAVPQGSAHCVEKVPPPYCICGLLQHHCTIPSKAALLTTCFTHQLSGIGGVGGADGAASEAG